MFEGSIPALVTPFRNDREQSIDLDQLAALVRFQAESGSTGIVLCGTTGESPTLSREEHDVVLRTAIAAAKGTALKTIAGTGSNSTREAIRLTEQAAALGIDACLIVAPYYNRPTIDGVCAHFRALNAVGVPLLIYNIPGRTGIDLSAQTIARMTDECPNIVGLKASNGNLEEITETARLMRAKQRPFALLSGDDALTLPILSVGGVGVISVIANVMPRVMQQMLRKFQVDGNTAEAASMAQILHPVCTALLKAGSNPAPIKALLNRVGLHAGGCRLPLIGLTKYQTEQLIAVVRTTLSELNKSGVAFDPILAEILSES